jgi:hypothetical protein
VDRGEGEAHAICYPRLRVSKAMVWVLMGMGIEGMDVTHTGWLSMRGRGGRLSARVR